MTSVHGLAAPGRPQDGWPRAPRLLLLTDRRLLPAGHDLVGQVAEAVSGGVDGVVLRERDLPDDARCALLLDLLAAVRRASPEVPVLCAWPAPSSFAGPADGFHLRSTDPVPAQHLGRPAPSGQGAAAARVLGRSCHHLSDLHRARAEQCDYVTLSPVAVTPSKPGYGPALGVSGLQRLLGRAAYGDHAPRVLALGGVTAGTAGRLVRAGADGVAVMGALMRTERPGAVAAALRAAVQA